ncbi:hypothetical protein SRABI64_03358 [Pseudomonas carnis]|nr:hypothetical protein SRABI64_03358 [Pseudomonas carnis]
MNGLGALRTPAGASSLATIARPCMVSQMLRRIDRSTAFTSLVIAPMEM